MLCMFKYWIHSLVYICAFLHILACVPEERGRGEGRGRGSGWGCVSVFWLTTLWVSPMVKHKRVLSVKSRQELNRKRGAASPLKTPFTLFYFLFIFCCFIIKSSPEHLNNYCNGFTRASLTSPHWSGASVHLEPMLMGNTWICFSNNAEFHDWNDLFFVFILVNMRQCVTISSLADKALNGGRWLQRVCPLWSTQGCTVCVRPPRTKGAATAHNHH